MITLNDRKLTISRNNAAGTAEAKITATIKLSGLDATLLSHGLFHTVKCELWELRDATDRWNIFERDDRVYIFPTTQIINTQNVTNNISQISFSHTVSQELLRRTDSGRCEFVGKFFLKNNTWAGEKFRYYEGNTNQVDITF